MNRRDLLRMGLLATSTPLLSLPLQGCDRGGSSPGSSPPAAPVVVLTTRRLTLTNFSTKPNPTSDATSTGDATAATDTTTAVKPTSKVVIDMTCGANWDIDDRTGDLDGIFNTHHGVHDGGGNFKSKDQSKIVLAIRSFDCDHAQPRKEFPVDIKEDNKNNYKSCIATVDK